MDSPNFQVADQIKRAKMLSILTLFKGTVSRYKRIFSNKSRMGIPNIQLSMWAMWFCDVVIMPLAVPGWLI